jgi:hypothetical protein
VGEAAKLATSVSMSLSPVFARSGLTHPFPYFLIQERVSRLFGLPQVQLSTLLTFASSSQGRRMRRRRRSGSLHVTGAVSAQAGDQLFVTLQEVMKHDLGCLASYGNIDRCGGATRYVPRRVFPSPLPLSLMLPPFLPSD